MALLDFVFPKYCINCKKLGDYICSNCFSFISFDVSMICLACNKGSIDGLTHPGCRRKYTIDGAFAATSYKGVMKKLIYSFKYKPFLSHLGDSLVELFYESIIQNEIFQKVYRHPPAGGQVLVPIPLYPNRLRKRGYNHAKLLSVGLSKKLNLEMIEILKRTKETKSQFGLDLKKRKGNVKGAFAISPSIPARHRLSPQASAGGLVSQYPNIFLVDDILTTGSTLFEAAKVLKRNGAKKVWGLTLARD